MESRPTTLKHVLPLSAICFSRKASLAKSGADCPQPLTAVLRCRVFAGNVAKANGRQKPVTG